ncbi:uncharacterized protein APUU_30738S [Aspergillus puulaauensis]|uniref:Acyltransferase 3 domain-containing protein n=1 Tax=Aspergillus puulaauensis TaxID=1220207 RepID=A0A7R7XK10_9EURO|nr:uncharacterized protein APUU_30738S [Aspergillus puulaauensis]BCS22513.1 hypothetical protein APUU_30738S [Aspergillus puulaauensis]
MERTLWLDGLRGLASACVALCHAVVFDSPSTFGFLYRSYWAEAPESRHLIQLPPFRIIFAGSSMVSLFMVISGFAISIPLLKARENAGFFRRLSSTATRRGFRLYLPALLSAALSHFLYFCNLFQLSSWDDPWVGLPKPLTAPWSHMKYLLWSVIYLLDISNHHQMNLRHGRLDPNPITVNLWTMPVEVRGSLTVYLLLLVLAFWNPQARYLALAGVAMYWFYMGQWDLFSFVSGLFLAEGYVASYYYTEADGELLLPGSSCQQHSSTVTNFCRKLSKSAPFSCLREAIISTMAVFLLCMCEGETLPPEYQFLHVFAPFFPPTQTTWGGRDQAEIARRCWASVGAVLAIYVVRDTSSSPTVALHLQRLLTSRPAQYLGRISFPLYLLHNPVYFIFKERVRVLLWRLLTWTSYPGTEEASRDAGLPFGVACAGAVLVCGVIMVFASDLWERTIDRRCLEIARRFEKRVMS